MCEQGTELGKHGFKTEFSTDRLESKLFIITELQSPYLWNEHGNPGISLGSCENLKNTTYVTFVAYLLVY